MDEHQCLAGPWGPNPAPKVRPACDAAAVKQPVEIGRFHCPAPPFSGGLPGFSVGSSTSPVPLQAAGADCKNLPLAGFGQ